MLYDFGELKLVVKHVTGIDPETINSKFKPITQELSRAELDKNVEFNTDGIFFVDERGNRHKGFLYIKSGYSTRIIRIARTSIPKFHVVNCEIIEQQKEKRNFNGHYVFSNEKVEMEDLYDSIVKEPEVCGYCVNLSESVYIGMKTSQYREEVILNEEREGNFFDGELPKDVSTDFWGYTADWDVTSKNYRMKKRFTCEGCGINLNRNIADGYFLETHHIDGNKLNNDENNLKCLCVLCHANVNKVHQENYSKGASQQKLRDFIKLFEVELGRIGNRYLHNY